MNVLLNWHLVRDVALGAFGVLLLTMFVLMARNSAVEWDITDEFLASLNPSYRPPIGDEVADEGEEIAA